MRMHASEQPSPHADGLPAPLSSAPSATADETRPAVASPALTSARGPVVAVCGLAGGAGTSTLAFLIARHAAAESPAPMLLVEVDAAAGGLARLARVVSPRSLGQMAGSGGVGSPSAGLPFATLDDGLRIIASAPRAPTPVSDADLEDVLAAARPAHGLTVVDCGTLQTPGARGALTAATHVVWTAPHARWTAEQVSACLLSDAAPTPTGAPELLAVIATRPRSTRGGGKTLRDTAAERCRRLVYVPFEAVIADGRLADPPGRIAGALTAIVTFLTTPPASD